MTPVRSLSPRLGSFPTPVVKHHVFPVGRGFLEVAFGDISADEADAVVNPTSRIRPDGDTGSVDRALLRTAGPELAAACRAASKGLAQDATGPILTPGFALRARFVIHLVPPVFADDPVGAVVKLGDCYRRAIDLAYDRGLTSLATPSLATGSRGYPLRDAARVAVAAVTSSLLALERPLRVRFVLFGPVTFDAYLIEACTAEK